MTPRKRNAITGIVVLGAMMVLLWMILTFSGRMMGLFKPKGTVVIFNSDRADGLSDGSPVLYNGVQVGKVRSVSRVGDNMHVRIEGEIENNPPLPANLVGQIKPVSQLGNSSQIDLRLKGPPTGQLAENQLIEIHFAGPSIFPPEFTDIMADVNHQKLVQHVDEAIISVKEQVEKAGKVMESVQDLIGDEKLQADLRQSVANIREATERANKLEVDLQGLTSNANEAVGDVRKTIARTDANIDRLSHQLGDNLDKLGQTLTQFQQVAEKINTGKGTAGALINDPKLYDEMATTAKELNVVAASLQRLVDQWEHEGVTVNLGKKMSMHVTDEIHISA